MATSLRILIVDDDAMLRAAIKALIGSEPTFEVVGEAGDGETAVRLAAERTPDVVLMDVRMPGRFDGIEATRRIVDRRDGAQRPIVIVLSGSGETAGDAVAAGAAGFVPKGQAWKLVDTIKAMLAAPCET